MSIPVELFKRWPGANNRAVERVPSLLAYDDHFTRVLAWGFMAGSGGYNNRVKHFKLTLDRPEYSQDPFPLVGGYLNRYPPFKTAVEVTSDYLQPLHQHLLELVANAYSVRFLQICKISYVLTAPDSWPDSSKALLRQAAIKAGLPEADIALVPELQAIACHCVTSCGDAALHAGSKFIGKTNSIHTFKLRFSM